MDDNDVGIVTIEASYTYIGDATTAIRCRIARADPRVRIPAVLLTYAADPDRLAPRLHLDGDHLTITDDHGQHVTYRIHWDNYSSGYYAEMVTAATTTEVTA